MLIPVAVFFASYCGISRSRSGTPSLVRAPQEEETDLRCLSVREAVNFAKSTNLLGVILEATTLVRRPVSIVVPPLPLCFGRKQRGSRGLWRTVIGDGGKKATLTPVRCAVSRRFRQRRRSAARRIWRDWAYDEIKSWG